MRVPGGFSIACGLVASALLASCGGGGGGAGTEATGSPTDATLAGLTIAPGTFIPAFSPAEILYSTDVVADVASIDVTATVSAAVATMTIGGAPIASGMSHAVAINVGANPIPVVVTAANATNKTYTITVTRPPISLTPSGGTIASGGMSTLAVRLPAATGADRLVSLAASPAGVLTIPPSVTVLATNTLASFTAAANSAGTTMITATFNADMATSTITVTP